jgi:hypothetical protein
MKELIRVVVIIGLCLTLVGCDEAPRSKVHCEGRVVAIEFPAGSQWKVFRLDNGGAPTSFTGSNTNVKVGDYIEAYGGNAFKVVDK